MEFTQKEWELMIRKDQAHAHAVTFCTSHGIPEEAIEETENGYRFSIEFNYK
jgi:hypothetical protein